MFLVVFLVMFFVVFFVMLLVVFMFFGVDVVAAVRAVMVAAITVSCYVVVSYTVVGDGIMDISVGVETEVSVVADYINSW